VNLEKDYRGSLQNGEYIVTPTALESLHRLAEGLTDDSPSRAWTITGPYGVGKSAFAVFLTRLLCSADRSGSLAREQLSKAAPDLAVKLDDLEMWRNGAKGYVPILITARRAPAPSCIAEGIVEALKSDKSQKLKNIAEKLNASHSIVFSGRAFHIPPDLVVDPWTSDGESASHRHFLFRQDVWMLFRRQISEEITSTISTAWYFTTKSGGMCSSLLDRIGICIFSD
jgi:hypothetical protein